MGVLLRFPRHIRASADSVAGTGRGTSAGQAASGQLSENHCIARSSRRTWMSAPPSIAPSFLPSSNARELTVDSPTPSISAYARATDSRCSMLLMPQLSVILPDKSTAILPGAEPVNSGHPTGMDLPAILQRIELRLKTLGLSPDAAARAAEVPDAIRNIRRAVEKGKGGINARTLSRLAKALKTTPAWLLGEDTTGPIDGLNLADLRQERQRLLDRIAEVQMAIALREQEEIPQTRRKMKAR